METVQSFINCFSRFSNKLHVHKLLQLSHPTNSFIVRKLIKGCNNLSGTSDTRLPITMDILKKNNVTSYFPLSFSALLRLGEIVAKSYADYRKILQREDISISYKDRHPTSLFLLCDIPKQ